MGRSGRFGLERFKLDAAQTRVLQSTAAWTLALGIILAVQAASTAPRITAVVHLLQIATISAVVNGAMGTMFILTSSSLRKVASTQRQDTTHLMKALSDFSNVLRFRSILFLWAMALIGVFVVLAVFFRLIGCAPPGRPDGS